MVLVAASATPALHSLVASPSLRLAVGATPYPTTESAGRQPLSSRNR